MDYLLITDTNKLLVEASFPTPAHAPSGSPCDIPSNTLGSFADAVPPRCAIIDHWSTRLLTFIPDMIQTALPDVVTPLMPSR